MSLLDLQKMDAPRAGADAVDSNLSLLGCGTESALSFLLCL